MKILLLSLFMIKNTFFSKMNIHGNKSETMITGNIKVLHKNTNLGNDERNNTYFADEICDVSKIARNMDILDRMNKLKNGNVDTMNIDTMNIKAGNIRAKLLSDFE